MYELLYRSVRWMLEDIGIQSAPSSDIWVLRVISLLISLATTSWAEIGPMGVLLILM